MQHSSADNLPSLSASCPVSANANNGAIEPESSSRQQKKPQTSKSNQAVTRAAKKYIAERVREDWTWPVPLPYWDIPHEVLQNIKEWRERASDSERSSPIRDPYRFESPESISSSPPPSPPSRKRGRIIALKEEMCWNEGLCTYLARRDAWTGARTDEQPDLEKISEYIHPNRLPNHPATGLPTPPCTSYSPTSPTFPTDHSTTLTPIRQSSQIFTTDSPPRLIPLAPPLFQQANVIKDSIKPVVYDAIYDKVIIKGCSPGIPINLKDVVQAMVAGWKKDGEWPPKVQEPEKSMRVRGGFVEGGMPMGKKLARRSVGRVKKALRWGKGDEGEGDGDGNVDGDDGEGEAEVEAKPSASGDKGPINQEERREHRRHMKEADGLLRETKAARRLLVGEYPREGLIDMGRPTVSSDGSIVAERIITGASH